MVYCNEKSNDQYIHILYIIVISHTYWTAHAYAAKRLSSTVPC